MGETRAPLSRERVLEAAVRIADDAGIAALTMRSLAEELGVKPMSLYHHVRNKEEILDGIVDVVFAEIDLPDPSGDWREQVRRRAGSARQALRRHPWALALLETRTRPGPETLRQHDAMLGTFRAAGFSLPATAHAYAVVDAFVYGFALQEASLPFDGSDDVTQVAEPILAEMPLAQYANLAEFAMGHVMQPGYDFGASFAVGLELVLDGLADMVARDGGARRPGKKGRKKAATEGATR
ncbi:MAG: TetR/AcrR family transcriptional regulator [Kineosporiaceae bacterium]